jgi:hypothetical protein
VCARDEAKGALALIDHLARTCFVQGLVSERIQTKVRARGEATLLSTCIEISLEEESKILSARNKGGSSYSSVPYRNVFENINRPPVRRSDRESSRRFPGSRRDMNSSKGFHKSGRGVEGNVNVTVGSAEYKTRCYTCGGLGHVARNCKKRNEGWKAKGNQRNETQVQKSSHSASQC